VEPHEVDTIIRHLAAAIEHQRTINDDVRTAIQEQREFNRAQLAINERLTAAIERLDVTQARIETLIAGMLPPSEHGREA
jgi:methyl-accepting chemotaxis protein